jgi:predicted LPLAT superfamily acyltransferase
MSTSSPSSATAQASWASKRERGALLLMRLMFFAMRWVARPALVPLVKLVTLYFFVFSRRARGISVDYLRRVSTAMPESGIQPTLRWSYRHFTAFADAILDKLDAWTGRLTRDHVEFPNYLEMRALAESGRGALLIGSHLGNLEVCRALATIHGRVKLTVLVHTAHADRFNRVLNMAGATDLQLVQVTSLDAGMALDLKARIDRGEWVVIAADRVPVHGGRTVDTRFLNGCAPLPIGPYVLASLLECPVYLLFCLRQEKHNCVFFEPFAERIQWRRAERDTVIAEAAQRFADRLEHYLRLAPLQWFNFYPFWREA